MTFDIQAIYTLIMSMLPTIVNIVTLIVAFKKLFEANFNVNSLKNQINMLIQENYELKKTMNELLTKIDHVEREWCYDKHNKKI